jgi:type I restriction enzyme, S subunit
MSEVNGNINSRTISPKWKKIRLGDVCRLRNGYAFKSSNYKQEGIPVIRISDINAGVVQANNSVKVESKKEYEEYLIEAGDLLIAMSGATTGKFGIYKNNEKAFQNQRVGNFIITDSSLNKYFLFYQLHNLKRNIEKDAYGGAQPNISSKKIEEMEIVLAPREVQDKIVSKIEELFSELDKSIEELKTAQQQLKVYRQAVLKWAFEGKLTNENVKDGKLPKGWSSKKLTEFTEKVFDGPFGSHLKSSDYVPDGIRVIRLENIGALEFRNEYKTFVSKEKYKTIEKHTVRKGDVIFSSFIMDNTRVVVLPNFIEKAINKADCFCVRVDARKMNNYFLAYFLSTKNAYNQLVDQIHGATRPRINTTQLKGCIVPYCSIEEQYEVVQEIESRLSVCDKIEETITVSLKKADALQQSILKEAFAGKLN